MDADAVDEDDQYNFKPSRDPRVSTKKPRLEPSPFQAFQTPNPFSTLASSADATFDNSQTTRQQISSHNNQNCSQTKSPPIYIKNVRDINHLLKEIRHYCPGAEFTHITLSDKVKLSPSNVDSHRQITHHLENTTAQYYTFQCNIDRSFRVVIRGLHPTCDVTIMMQELRELGYDPVQMLPVHHPVTKIPLPLFFLDLRQNPKNQEIFQLTRLYNGVIKVEPPKPKRKIIQCHKCQEYGHSKNFCHMQERCVKCDGTHSSANCDASPQAKAVCVNCKGNHTANYGGCPVHTKLQKASRRFVVPSQRIEPHEPRPVNIYELRQEEFPSLKDKVNPSTQPSSTQHQQYPKTFASAVSTPNHNNTLFNILFDKIDNLISMIQPLVLAVTQMLPIIMKQK